MDTPVVLYFYIIPSANSTVIRSALVKEYFSKLTSNVEVLYPTQIHHGLLLCKSRRTEEKIFNMRHILPNGSTLNLYHLSHHLFQHVKCSIDAQIMQLSETTTSFQQCLPFLHASGGNIHPNPDGSVSFEGHIFILNSIHSYLINKTRKPRQTTSTNTPESFNLRSKNLIAKITSGKLVEQNVDSILIPMNDKYKLHKAFDRQLQAYGGTFFYNSLKELIAKGARAHEGEIILFPNRDLKIPAKTIITFVVPRLSNHEGSKDKSTVDSFQPTYEQMIYRTLQAIDQYGITTLAMPVLEPSVKSSNERRHANEMAACAMINAIRQFSQNSSIKLKRILIIDHETQIKQMSKRVKKYQKQFPTTNNNNIDLDTDDLQSFTCIFGVPKIPETLSSASDSDEDLEPEEYQLPYTDHAKS